MNAKRNKKLCHSCEGEIDKDTLYCLYCGADLSVEVPNPPYQASEPIAEAVVTKVKEESPLFSYALLVPGSVFFIFALFMILFSKGETLTLQWDASYWYIYLLVSAPLLYLGLRSK